jgi:Xaa-Pro dipeptidase
MKRAKRIYKAIAENNKELDAVLLKNSSLSLIDPSFFWVTGLERGLFEDCAAILWPDGRITLLVTQLEELAAESSKQKLEIEPFNNKKEYSQKLSMLLSHVKRVGLNFNGLLAGELRDIKNTFPSSELIDISSELLCCRLIKDQEEVKLIQKACDIASEVAKEIPGLLKPGIRENELAAEINYRMEKRGASGPSFETITSYGPNTAEPHYSGGDCPLKKGELALADYGATYKRYRSDVTRTWVLGKAKPLQKRMYAVVERAQQIAFEELEKKGATMSGVHDAVAKYINSTEFKGRFIHSTGHSLGLETHDGYRLYSGENHVLMPGMVFTVEPGVYIPHEGGIRIEDDVLIKENGIEVLTKIPRELEI